MSKDNLEEKVMPEEEVDRIIATYLTKLKDLKQASERAIEERRKRKEKARQEIIEGRTEALQKIRNGEEVKNYVEITIPKVYAEEGRPRKYLMYDSEITILEKIFGIKREKYLDYFLARGKIRLNENHRIYYLGGGSYDRTEGYHKIAFGLAVGGKEFPGDGVWWVNGKKVLPSLITELNDLEYLLIDEEDWGPKCSEITKDIGKLKKLKVLYIINSGISKIPEELGELEELEDINFSNNPLEDLPNSLGRLTKLRKINISKTPLIKDISPIKLSWYLLKELKNKGVEIQPKELYDIL